MRNDAELLFTGGRVFTATGQVPGRPIAADVAVRGGRIAAVGADLGELRGARTEVIDLRGGLLTPGFQDAHVHPVWGGLDLLRCWVGDEHDERAYLARIGAYAASHPEEPWVLGGGWSMPAFPGGTPTAAALDAVVGDRPAFLTNRDGHGAWVNSRTLELAGITRDTPDPADGRIERMPDGTPSGTLHEGAVNLVNRLMPPTDDDRLLEALLLGQSTLHSFGITAWQDAIVGTYGDAGDPGPAYVRAAASGVLTGRVVGALWWDRAHGLEQLDSLRERREAWTGGRFAATSVKIMQDGVPENFTAAMLEPYLDADGGVTDRRGISFVEPRALTDAAVALDAAGFQLHVHAIGDRAVRESLDAIAAARAANGPNDARHHIAHVQVVHPDDIRRFAELDVTANIQALWASLEPQMVELNLPFLGQPRASWQYPFGDLARAGTRLAGGSDWSVSTPDPLQAMHVAVTRLSAPAEHAPADQPVFLPQQRLDLAAIMTAYTRGSAWVNHLDETGAIAVRRLADLAVLDGDPFAGPATEIGATRVTQTFVGGERVFAAGS